MRCIKCGYISFDFNQVCPKCNKDISGLQSKMNIPSFRPDPPSLLGVLIGDISGTQDSIPGHDTDADFAEPPEPYRGIGLSEAQKLDTEMEIGISFDESAPEISPEESLFDLEEPREEEEDNSLVSEAVAFESVIGPGTGDIETSPDLEDKHTEYRGSFFAEASAAEQNEELSIDFDDIIMDELPGEKGIFMGGEEGSVQEEETMVNDLSFDEPASDNAGTKGPSYKSGEEPDFQEKAFDSEEFFGESDYDEVALDLENMDLELDLDDPDEK